MADFYIFFLLTKVLDSENIVLNALTNIKAHSNNSSLEKAKLTNFIYFSIVSFANCDICVYSYNAFYINEMC